MMQVSHSRQSCYQVEVYVGLEFQQAEVEDILLICYSLRPSQFFTIGLGTEIKKWKKSKWEEKESEWKVGKIVGPINI